CRSSWQGCGTVFSDCSPFEVFRLWSSLCLRQLQLCAAVGAEVFVLCCARSGNVPDAVRYGCNGNRGEGVVVTVRYYKGVRRAGSARPPEVSVSGFVRFCFPDCECLQGLFPEH